RRGRAAAPAHKREPKSPSEPRSRPRPLPGSPRLGTPHSQTQKAHAPAKGRKGEAPEAEEAPQRSEEAARPAACRLNGFAAESAEEQQQEGSVGRRIAPSSARFA